LRCSLGYLSWVLLPELLETFQFISPGSCDRESLDRNLEAVFVFVSWADEWLFFADKR
jgi:hypothetical protein